jgi:YidC/Oxa1 family membrane protein insertase
LRLHTYLGPKDDRLFSAAEQAPLRDFTAIRDIDLVPPCFCTIPGAVTMAKVLLWLMNLIHGFLPSWGLCIIVITLIVRGSLLPLNYRQQKTMRGYQEKMTRLKPKMDALKAKYKDKPKQLNQELMKFNKEHKLFPPLMGCLPMLVTMPVFLGLFTALRVAFELRHQSFLFIADLSEPDRLIPVEFTLPLLGPMHGINILPFVWIGLFLLLQRNIPKSTDPQQAQMQQIMKFMPVVFGIFLYNYASALMVYMVASSAFGMIEQKVLKAKLGTLAAGAPTAF